MEGLHSNNSSSRQTGSGLPMLLLALLLVAIAAAIDIAWMAPGRATSAAPRGEYAVAQEHSTAAVDAMVAAHHSDKARPSTNASEAN